MANLTTRKSGSRFIRFVNNKGEVKTITLGRVTKRDAEAVLCKVEALASCMVTGCKPTREVAVWVRDLDDKLHDKLADVGLVTRRDRTTLGDWLTTYLDERKADLKPESYRKLKQTEAKLLAHFDKDRPLHDITKADAKAWTKTLSKLKLATRRTHGGNAKTILNEAVNRHLLDENPFDDVDSGNTASDYRRYVTRDEIAKVIEAAPGTQWPLLIGLARYAGLRVPSESHLLTFGDVDFDQAVLYVTSPKTEGTGGKGARTVPICPELMERIQARYDDAEEGDTHLVTLAGKGAMIRKMRDIWRKAKVTPWQKLWQTLRSSCETDWYDAHPVNVVGMWMGHDPKVSLSHYARHVKAEDLERATGRTKAHRNAHRLAPHTPGNERKTGFSEHGPGRRETDEKADKRLEKKVLRDVDAMEPGGVEPPNTLQFPGENSTFSKSAPNGAPISAGLFAELVRYTNNNQVRAEALAELIQWLMAEDVSYIEALSADIARHRSAYGITDPDTGIPVLLLDFAEAMEHLDTNHRRAFLETLRTRPKFLSEHLADMPAAVPDSAPNIVKWAAWWKPAFLNEQIDAVEESVAKRGSGKPNLKLTTDTDDLD